MTRRTFSIAFAFLIFSFLLLAGLSFFSWQSLLSAKQSSAVSTSDFTVASGEPASSVAHRLEQSGIIRSAWAATLYLKISGLENSLKPGTYKLSPAVSTQTTVSQLTSGPQDIRVTFPEGWRREQIAARLTDSLPEFSSSEFLRLSATLEGRLFPDTYLLPSLSTPEEVIDILTANFYRKSQLDLPAQSDVLILASLVEREAKNDADRRLVAGILKNRLSVDMPLQVDATVQYAVDTAKSSAAKPGSYQFWQPIFDTQYPSLYNTYLHPGLPPAPIANPGLASIQAVLHPQTSSYLYYLTDSQGITHYAVTLEQHNLNIDKYLRP